jgi:hypothetical protein
MVIGWAACMYTSSLSPHGLPARAAQHRPGSVETQVFFVSIEPGWSSTFASDETGPGATPGYQTQQKVKDAAPTDAVPVRWGYQSRPNQPIARWSQITYTSQDFKIK